MALRSIDPADPTAEGHPYLSVVRDPAFPSAIRALAEPARISVVIPTLNEERNIAWVMDRIPTFVDEVVLVDGRSHDRTIEVALAVRPDLVVVREPEPGKGVALRSAFAAATGDIIVMLDADGSMEPGEIERFVDAIKDGADVVKGSRFLPGGGSIDISRVRRLGNVGLLGLANVLYRTGFSELCYGYMAFRRSCLPRLGLRSTGFEIETEIVVRAIRAGLEIREVPSFEAHRRYGTSHLRTFRDGWRVARTLMSERFRPALEELDILLEPPAIAFLPVSAEEAQVRQES